MNQITIKTEKELKSFVDDNREDITEINGVKFGKLYPMLTCSNKHASYYDVESQDNRFLYPPFVCSLISQIKGD